MSIITRTNLGLLTVLTASLLGLPLRVHALPGDDPKKATLVLGITVEGLDENYLDLLRSRLSDHGFRLLEDKGVVLEDVLYGPGVDATAATAIIYTGATPSINGVTAATRYDATRRVPVPMLTDAEGNYSAKGLPVSTLADEVRVSEGGINHVYSIAPNAQQSVIMAGHAGNAAIYLDDVTGRWSVPTAYTEPPTLLPAKNAGRSSLSIRLDTLRWVPLLDVGQYPGIPAYKKAYPFRHVFPAKDKDRYRAFKVSAPVNREVTSLAADLIKGMKLGGGDVADMVSLAYTVAPYPYSKDSDSRMEVLDSYLRLDADLGKLFKAVEEGPGMDHTVIFLAGVPAAPSSKRDDERFGIPYGQFSGRKAVALLNMYLIAAHGNGEWVTGYHNRQIHLNANLAKEHGLEMAALRREAADFLLRMEGVCEAWIIDEILSGRAGSASEALARNTSAATAGDILLTITPGWEIIDGGTETSLPRAEVSRLADKTYPVYIMAPGVKAQTVGTTIDACILAPTVARLLRIRSPNAAAGRPLRLR